MPRSGTERTSLSVSDGVDSEKDLHEEILKYCLDHKWIAFHCSMAHKSHATIGQPDFIIAADGGRMFMIECKSREGKPTPEQFAIMHQAGNLGHRIEIVRSKSEFLDLVETK